MFNGKDTSLEKLSGQWIVVNYWADWCAPCIKELPELYEFAKENNDILVYVFNFDELDEEDLRPVAKRFGLMLPSLISHPREIWVLKHLLQFQPHFLSIQMANWLNLYLDPRLKIVLILSWLQLNKFSSKFSASKDSGFILSFDK